MAKISAHGNFRFFSYDPKDNPYRVKFGHGENEKKRSFLDNSFGFGRRNRGVRVYTSRNKSKEILNTKEEMMKGDVVEYDSDEGDEEDEEELEFGEYERDELSCFRGLVLDISYRPVNVVCWKRAMCLEFMEKVSCCS